MELTSTGSGHLRRLPSSKPVAIHPDSGESFVLIPAGVSYAVQTS